MKLIITEPAEKDLLGIDPKQRVRIQRAIDRMASGLWTSDIKKLKGQDDTWRLRAGDWRIMFQVDQTESAIYVHRIKHRKEAYRS